MCHVKDSISGQRTRDDFPWPKKTPTGSWKITCETRRLHDFCLVWISLNGIRALIFSDTGRETVNSNTVNSKFHLIEVTVNIWQESYHFMFKMHG